MSQPFIFKTASFFPKLVSFEESPGGAGDRAVVLMSRRNTGGWS